MLPSSRSLRFGASILLLAPLAAFLASGSCRWAASSEHHKNHDPNRNPVTDPGDRAEEPEVLAFQAIVVPTRVFGRHPVAALLGIRGVAAEMQGEQNPAESCRRVADRFLREQDDLLGLPAQAGGRRFEGVTEGENGWRVRYLQFRGQRGGEATSVKDAATDFHFDMDGRLRTVENAIFIFPFAPRFGR